MVASRRQVRHNERNSDYIAGDKSTLMESTVNGMSGPITVNGEEYDNVMPAMSYLSDEELASILTYVVNSWGNPGGRFKASIIGEYRVRMGLEAKQAGGERHPGTPEALQALEGAPMDVGELQVRITPGAPDMTEAEFARAQKLYFERCAGCHGVLRKGATGKPLTTDNTQEKGTDYLKALINFGSPAGMPNWGTPAKLTEADIDIMARFLQHEPPMPPEFGMAEVKGTWEVLVPVDKRPTKPQGKFDSAIFSRSRCGIPARSPSSTATPRKSSRLWIPVMRSIFHACPRRAVTSTRSVAMPGST